MPIQVRIPVQLRALTGGQEVVAASGTSVLQLIENIDKQFPGVKDRICEADARRGNASPPERFPSRHCAPR